MSDSEDLAQFAVTWQEEWNAHSQEAALRNQQLHQRLVGMWPYLDPPNSIPQDVLTGLTLIDCISRESRFAEVYRALDRDGKVVCVKIGSTVACEIDTVTQAFENEVRILKFLNSSSLGPKFIRNGELSFAGTTLPYVVMEYIDNLVPVSRFRFKSESSRNQFLVDLCQQIDKLHSAGVIHGDLHPENVFVKNQEQRGRYIPVILDFNIARLNNDSESLREFGPRIPFSVNEQYFLARRLTPAFDIACISMVLECLLFEQYPPISAANELALRVLLKDCRQHYPDLRPQTGAELQQQLQLALQGQAVNYRPSWLRQIKLIAENYPIPTIVTIVLTFFVCLALLFAIYANQTAQDKNRQLQENVRQLRQANSVTLDSMTKLLDFAFADDRASDQAQRRLIRVELANDLEVKILNISTDPAVLLDSLMFGRNLVQAQLDVDGCRSAQRLLRSCVQAVKKIRTNASLLSTIQQKQLELLLIQFLALDSFVEYELADSPKDLKRAEASVRDATEFYDAIETNDLPPDLETDFLKAGYLLGHRGFYPQHREQSFRNEKGRTGAKIFAKALSYSAYRNDEQLRLGGQIHATYGRCVYKSGIKTFPVDDQLKDRITHHYQVALELLDECSQTGPEIESNRAYVRNLIGQSYRAQGKYELALPNAKAAFETSRRLVDQFRGSKFLRKEMITNGWNYADIYATRVQSSKRRSKSNKDRRSEVEIREQVVAEALDIFRSENGQDSREDLAVNLQRLIIAYIDLGDSDSATKYARLHRESLGFFEPGSAHSLGFPLLAVLLVLEKESPNATYSNEISEKVEAICEQFRIVHNKINPEQTEHAIQHLANGIRDLFDSPVLKAFKGGPYHQRLLDELESYAR